MSCLEADQHVVLTSNKQPESPSLASTDDDESTPSTPQCFAAHQYELEVSPEHPIQLSKVTPTPTTPSSSSLSSSSSKLSASKKRSSKPKSTPTLRSASRTPFTKLTGTASASPYIITEKSLPMTKTVYLIRHAESDENRRKESLKSSMQGLGKLKLPKKEDVVASMELMNLVAQLDSDVSPRGQAQIDQLGRRIAKDNFVHKMGIQLVAHSPLKRARQTCYGMLQCVAPSSSSNNNNNESGDGNNDNNNNKDTENENDPTVDGCKHPSVQRVVELDMLSERTPIEWFPVQHDAFTKRIAEFEMWLSEQPEEVIAIVGHSLYFKNMLGLESKFHNVDVWSIQFDFTVENSIQRVRKDVHVANENETKKKIQKQLNKIGNIINARNEKKTNPSVTDNTEDEVENRDEINATSVEKEKNSPNLGHQTCIDGVSLEELELPRGWRDLKHHYRYEPNYIE